MILNVLKFTFILALIWGRPVVAKSFSVADKWMATPLKQKNGIKTKVFKRFVGAGKHVFPIATITYTKFPKKGRLPKNLGLTIQRAFGGTAWKIERQDKNLIIDGNWKGGNRHIRYQIKEEKDSIIMSFALMRRGYLDSSIKEVRTIQRALSSWSQNKKKKTTWLDSIIDLIPTANAAGSLNGLFGNLPPGLSNGGGGGGEDIGSFTNSLDNFSSSFVSLSGQIDTANTNMAETNVQLGRSNDNWAQTNANMAESNRVLDTNWNNTNQELGRSNDIAERMTDPKHMFKLAAATSAGAVFGATLANLVIDGVTNGAKWVWDLITDGSGKKKRWEKFKLAREKWEETLDGAQKLEKLLDQFLTSQELMKKIRSSLTPEEQNKLTRENLISHLSIDSRKLKKKKRKLEKLFDETENPICENYYASKLDQIENLVKTSDGMKNYLSEQTFKVFNDDLFCDELSGIMRKLGEAESAIQTYRLNILNAKTEWASKNEDVIEDNGKTIKRLNDKDTHEDYLDQRIENAEDFYEELEDGVKVKQKAWIETCIESDPKYESFSFDDEKDATQLNIEDKCEKRYEKEFAPRDKRNLAKAKIARDKKIKLAKRDFEKSKSRPIELNADAEDQRLLSYYKWFSDLEDQQYCYVNKDDKSCKDKAQAKFMGPFYVKDKARVKLKEICGKDEYDY